MVRSRPLLIAAGGLLVLMVTPVASLWGPGAPALAPVAPAMAHPPAPARGAPRIERPWDPQHEARREVRAGNQYRLRDIERRIVPTMPGMQYLGPEYDAEAMAYRLKFIRNGRVEFVDVDARTGLVRGRSF